MTHIHVPDGVLPVWLWGSGWVVAVALLLIAIGLGLAINGALTLAVARPPV